MKNNIKILPLNFIFSKPTLKLAPATLAIVLQLAALVLMLITVVVVSSVFAVRFSVLSLVMMQAISAVVLCILANMAVWWRWIHGLLPLTMFVMSMLSIPNEVYLIGFLISFSIFWTTFRSQVPFFPSRPMVREKVAALIPDNQSCRMIDIGSGLGDLSMHIAKAKKHSQVEGIEIAPMPWLISVVRAWISKSSAKFTLGNYHELDFANYDLVFAYLSPVAMPALWQKAKQDMQAGSLLVSYEFEIPNASPSFTIQNGSAPTIFVWEM